MARIRIPCLVGKTNLAGLTSWYWQPSKTLKAAGWTALTLGKDEGRAIAAARARNGEVERWKLGGDPAPGAALRQRRMAGTLGALVERYRREVVEGKRPDGRARLAGKTAETYEISLKRIEHWAGKHPLAYVTPARVRALRDTTARPADQTGGLGHSAAFNLLKTLRQVMAFAEKVDLIAKGSNPARDFDLGAPPPRRTVWELDDDMAFDQAAFALGLPSMALARELALYTAQREGDLIAMTEAQLAALDLHDPVLRERLGGKDGLVKGWCMTQRKTGTPLEIPLEPAIRARVEATLRTNRARDKAADPPRLVAHVLVNDKTGLPWKKRHFIRTWTKVLELAANSAGRPHMTGLVWHDLRRTRVVRLRRRGMPREMIAAITGTGTRSIEAMLKVYGPIDPTITASAIAATLDPLPAPGEGGRERA